MKGKRGQQQKSRKAKSLIFEQDGGLVDCTTPPRSESGRAPFPQAAPLCRPLLLSSSFPSQVTANSAFLSLFFSNWSRLLQKSQGETSSSKSSITIHTYPDMYKVTGQNHRLRQFLGGSIPRSVRHKHNSCLLFTPVGSSGHQRTQWI